MTNVPTISVAVVTRNRPASLARTLKSLAAQVPAPDEVIVSDDSDVEHEVETRAVVDTFGYIYCIGPKRGLYANRNFVATRCSGSHIRSADDDHEFPPGHLAACAAAVAADQQSVWFIGERYPLKDGNLTEQVCPGQLNAAGYSECPADPDDCWAISDGASIYPRLVFDLGCRFLENYPFGAAYLEFGSYLHHLGFRMRYLSDTYIVHHLDINARSFMDGENELSSRLCAMLCYSFLYQMNSRNITASTLRALYYLTFRLRRRPMALRLAFRGIKERHHSLKAMRQMVHADTETR